LVTLSIVVAIVSSYVALDLGSRVTSAQGYKRAPYWLVGGALSLGSGIWSMHFIGMLAYKLPIPTSYDPTLTLLSLALPVLTSGFGLYILSRHAMKPFALLGGGVLIGVGIAAMHYAGMAAMKMQPPIHYRILWVALSIFIAVSASVASLWSAFRLRMETILSAFWKKAGSALVLGAAIAGMHYTGMAASVFAPNSVCTVGPQNIDNVRLADVVGGLSLLFMATTLLISAFDAYVAEHSLRHADVLHRVNVDLERRTAALERSSAPKAAAICSDGELRGFMLLQRPLHVLAN